MTDKGAPQSALVTGATGFIGSHLTKRLVKEGWQVSIVVRPGSDLKILGEAARKVDVRRFHGTHELAEDLKRHKPDMVFHLATMFVSEHAPDQLEAMVQGNILFGTQLLEAMSQAECSALVNAGTSWQHYNSEGYEPVNLYAAMKQGFEDIMRFYQSARGVRALTLKMFDTYGPGDPRKKLFALLRRAAGSGASVPMSGGEQLMNLVYIDDVVDAFMLAAQRVREGDQDHSYAVGADRCVALRDLVRIYAEVTGRALDIQWGAQPYRKREVFKPWDSGERMPGWTPRVSLEDGLRRMEAAQR